MAVSATHFKRLLEMARARAEKEKDSQAVNSLTSTRAEIERRGISQVETKNLGIGKETSDEDAADIIHDVVSLDVADNIHNREYHSGQITSGIVLNDKQQKACDAIVAGKSVVFVGAAGTGKTATQRKVTEELIDQNKLPRITAGTKYLRPGLPGACVVSFTKKAVNNIRHQVVEELRPHVITIHKLLEFSPEFYEIEDPSNPGNWKKSMRFVPSRNAFNPLPQELKLIIHEESSMESVELYELLMAACPHKPQEVFIGDIQQLPPVFGLAILGFKMLELEVIELTEIYRQAAKSPIIDLAWKVLKGNARDFRSKINRVEQTVAGKKVARIQVPTLDALSKTVFDAETGKHIGTVKIQVWQKKLTTDLALLTAIKQFTAWERDGYYDPTRDIILCPFNKAFGTVELNLGISDYLGKKRNAEIFEVIAGFQTYFLAVGDRVMYDKEDAVIVSIRPNGTYLGKRTRPPSTLIDRTGHIRDDVTKEEIAHHTVTEKDEGEASEEAMELFLSAAADSVEERVQAASHIIGIRFTYEEDKDQEETALSSAQEINNLLGGYAITVHKFQGSQERKVFLVFHQSHSGPLLCRELLYTAVTRPQEYLHIICEPDTLEKCVRNPRIKGNTIAEKAAFFKGKGSERDIQQKQAELKLISDANKNGNKGDTREVSEAVEEEKVSEDKPKFKLDFAKLGADLKLEEAEKEEKPLTPFQKLAAMRKKGN